MSLSTASILFSILGLGFVALALYVYSVAKATRTNNEYMLRDRDNLAHNVHVALDDLYAKVHTLTPLVVKSIAKKVATKSVATARVAAKKAAKKTPAKKATASK